MMIKIGTLPIGSIIRFHFSGTWWKIVDETKYSNEYVIYPANPRIDYEGKEVGEYRLISKDKDCEVKDEISFIISTSNLRILEEELYLNITLVAQKPLSFYTRIDGDKELKLYSGDYVSLNNIFLGKLEV